MSHAAGCHMPEPMTDPAGYLRCPACTRIQATPQASTQPTGYVCRVHHDQPVTFRGKGCTLCPRRKANKRKAPEPSDDTEMETYR